MRKLLGLALLGVLAAAAPARADIERKAVFDCKNNQICFYIWPALPDMPGWHRDEDLSYQYHAAFMVPDSDSKANPSPTVILANAVAEDGYKTDNPGATALDGFIGDDIVTTRKNNSEVTIRETDPAVAADGVTLRVFIIGKLKGGHSQIIAYTEDGDKDGKFFCVLILDSVAKEPVETQLPLFRQMVAKYKHFKPAN